jgi:ABC-2 type transport system permease protein
MNLRVVKALVLKYLYVCSRNTFRALDVCFWPVMDLLIWGFMSIYMMRVTTTVPKMVPMLISAIILWNVLYRAQQVVCVAFLDDVWSRNMLNIWAAPIRPIEYVGAGYVVGFMQAFIVVVVMGTLAGIFYSFNIMELGLHLAILFANLIIMGWSLGLVVTGLFLRFGPPAEALAWAVPFLFQPISAVFYPVEILPPWMQLIAQITPASHVFEGMRELISTGHMNLTHMYLAMGLNILYMTIAGFMFKMFYEEARKRGFLAKYAA